MRTKKELTSFFWLDMLCVSAQKEFDVNIAYAKIVKDLRVLKLIEDIVGARDTTLNLTDSFLLSEIEEAIYNPERYSERLHEIEFDDSWD